MGDDSNEVVPGGIGVSPLIADGNVSEFGEPQGWRQKFWGDLYKCIAQMMGDKLSKLFLTRNNGDNLLGCLAIDPTARGTMSKAEYQAWILDTFTDHFKKLKPAECTMSSLFSCVRSTWLKVGQ